MAEYITKEALVDDLRGSYNDLMRIYDKLQYPDEKEVCKGQLATFLECILRVKDAPTASVVEVKHGRWIALTECANEGVYCSVCHKKVYRADYAWCAKRNKVRSNYCPNCGADMRGANYE